MVSTTMASKERKQLDLAQWYKSRSHVSSSWSMTQPYSFREIISLSELLSFSVTGENYAQVSPIIFSFYEWSLPVAQFLFWIITGRVLRKFLPNSLPKEKFFVWAIFVCFLAHTWWYSELSPGSVLRNHSWKDWGKYVVSGIETSSILYKVSTLLTVLFVLFVCLYFLFIKGYTWQYSGATPNFALRGHFWQCSGGHMGCQEWNPDWLHVRQTVPLCYHFIPS